MSEDTSESLEQAHNVDTNGNGTNTAEEPVIATSTEGQLIQEDSTSMEDIAEEPQEQEDDDDFGDFSDASFDDFEEPQAAPEPTTPEPSTHDTQTSAFPQSLFISPELPSKLDELCHEAFPRELDKFQPPTDTSLLNERSTHLLERLITKPYLRPYNWQRGHLRRQLLVTLGLPDDTVVHKRRPNEFDTEAYVVRKLEEMHIDSEERSRIIEESESEFERLGKAYSEDELAGMSEEELAEAVRELQRDVAKVEKMLCVWEDERVKLEEDHKTFEGVVENLVGHTQRLRREEALKSLKKGKKEGRLGFLKRK